MANSIHTKRLNRKRQTKHRRANANAVRVKKRLARRAARQPQ